MSNLNKKNNNKGVALITVLIIVFLITAIISNITVTNYRVIKRLTNQKIMEQCYSILYAAVDFGRAGLATSAATSSIDTSSDIWAQPIPKTNIVDNIYMSGYIVDEQSKFNINDLVNNGQVNLAVLNQFSVLLTELNIPSAVAQAVAYYMAAPANEGSIMNDYTAGNPAYRPAGKPLVDLSELMLVKGMQPEWVYKLNQYVTAIPVPINSILSIESASESASTPSNNNSTFASSGSITVNVNTASAEVIAAKSGIPLPVAQRLVTIRTNTPFKTNQDITNFLTTNGIILSGGGFSGGTQVNVSTLSTNSNYFTIHAIVDKDDYEFKWEALVYRANRSGQWPVVLWQHPE
jgi:type II secretory pathway component PulK